jgi:hypothetical protein
MEHPRVEIEGDREQRPDVVLEVAHARHNPVRGAHVIDEVQVAEGGYVGHDRSM